MAMVMGSGIALTSVEANHYYGGGSYYDTKEITLIHIGDIHGHTGIGCIPDLRMGNSQKRRAWQKAHSCDSGTPGKSVVA